MEDKYLTVVEEHVDRLGEMAKNIQEELQIQDRMVDDLGNRIDTAQEHVTNVNTRMKVGSATFWLGDASSTGDGEDVPTALFSRSLSPCALDKPFISTRVSLSVSHDKQEVLRSVRSADKFCVDIMCILLLLGMIAVLYAVVENT